ncbi:MAG: asparagine synthase (glutamine-hydrolyzing) [Bryobacteraceae bacterium]
MCGIAGYVSWDTPPHSAVLRAMEQSLAHRGPDEGSIWSNQVCGLAHRRLRVIDLSPRAAQPMADETGDVTIIFNGEIYNFPELRRELENQGHHFRSESDTETILRGYQSWGDKLFARLRGMFAFAIWNERAQELIFARDRFGKKPFFFAQDKGRFVFGSELPVFRQVPDMDLSISRSAFREYIEFGYVQSPQTILEQVRQLPAGHFGVLHRADLQIKPFWTLPVIPPQRDKAIDVARGAEILEESLRDAVACRLISDVPLGCFLSGGIDSSLVAAHAQELAAGRLQTFNVGFENSAMSEAKSAAAIAAHLGTDHHEITIRAETLIDEFVEILAQTTEPIGDDSFLPTFAISRATRQQVTVALSGDGGDEVCCGYDKYRQFAVAKRLRRLAPAVALKAMSGAGAHWAGDRASKQLEALATPTDEHLARWLSTLWKERELDELLAPRPSADRTADAFARSWQRRPGFPEIERFMLTDVETYLSGDILPKVDRASMAHGLEVRCPFLDQKFFDASLQIASRVRPGKPVLKEMLARRVPRQLFERPKSGFGLPIHEWYRAPLRAVLEKYTSAVRIKKRGLLRSAAVQRYVGLHLSGRRNFARKLHAIVAFEIWADEFFGEHTESI